MQGMQKFLFFILILGFLNRSYGQETDGHPYGRPSFTIAVGNWQPHSLNDEPRFNTFGAAGATAYIGFSVFLPLKNTFGIYLSTGYWALRDLDEVASVHSLTLLPVSAEFKFWMVPDNWLSAYVQYGGGFYWGIENVTAPLEKINKARTGLGLHLGAGFDVSLSDWFGVGLLFQYVYMVFQEPLGGVEDFSGPRISGLFHFML